MQVADRYLMMQSLARAEWASHLPQASLVRASGYRIAAQMTRSSPRNA
jgi:hypothetical protein